MEVRVPLRWLIGIAALIGPASYFDTSVATAGLLRPVQLTRGNGSTRVPEGGVATSYGTYYDADLRNVELSVSLGELELVPPERRNGYFYDDLRRLNLGAQTSGSRLIYGLGDLDGDGDVDVFVPQRSDPHIAFLNDGSGRFTQRSSPATGDANAVKLLLADLDQDGDLDALILVSAPDYFGGEVWVNDGSASFARHTTFPLESGNAAGVELGDLDGDGDPDLVSPLGDDSTETITRINDQLSFAVAGPELPSGSSRVALGDLDGDGDRDAVLVNSTAVTLWKNDGGSFAPLGSPIAASYIQAVALGDLDNDGDLDIVLGHWDRWARVLFNDGTGEVEAEGAVHARNSETVELIDIDHDGDLDVAAHRTLWLNDGTGRFADSGQWLPLGRFGDINGDSAPDLLAGAGGDVWLNGLRLGRWAWTYEVPDGPHEETVELTATSPGEAPVRKEWAIFVTNVLPEVVAAEDQFTDSASATIRLGSIRDAGDDGPWQVSVDWGDGSSDSFQVSTAGDLGARAHTFAGRGRHEVVIGVTEASGGIGVEDSLTVHVAGGSLQLLRDGGPLVSAGEGGIATATGSVVAYAAGALRLEASRGSIELVEGPGSRPLFLPTGQTPSGGPRSLGDLDGDGDLDAFAGGKVWLNRGDGTFETTNQNLPTSLGVHMSSLADLDGDGDLDAFVTIPNDESYSLRNDGNGHFTEVQRLQISEFTRALALGDVNGDGFVDVVSAVFLDEYRFPSLVGFNRGDATFFNSNQALPDCNDIALGDVDDDGDLDAFVVGATFSERVNRVCFNDGDGYFSRCDDVVVASSRATSVALGDLDADGDLDAFVGYWRSDDPPDRVFLNDGAGTFTATGQKLGGSGTGGVALGDLDGDGDLDAWLNSAQAIWLNDGSGRFEASGLDFGTVRESALGDLDGDGKLDVFTDQVYLNRSPQASWIWTESVDDGPDLFDVSLTASLGSRAATEGFEVSVSNLPPRATLELASEPNCAQPLRFVVNFQGDPSPVDEQAGYTTIFDVFAPGASVSSRTFVPPADPPAAFAEFVVPAKQCRPGSWRVQARVFDKDRGVVRLETQHEIVDAVPPAGKVPKRRRGPTPIPRDRGDPPSRSSGCER